MKNKYLFVFSFLVLFSCNQDPEFSMEIRDPEQLVSTVKYKSVSEVPDDLLSLDIYYTDKVDLRKPVVIWVHGGAWCIGDKKGKIDQKVDLFRSEGYILVSVNYRLSPFPFQLEDEDRIKFPKHNIDVADAVAWVYNNISTYGGDLDKVALMGHSAGAHLVSLTGTATRLLEDRGIPFSFIKGVATIDTEAYSIRPKIKENNELCINAFGVDSLQNEQASPLFHVSSDVIYPLFFVAKRGLPDRIATADAFINELQAVGCEVQQIDGSVYTHAGINDAIGMEGEPIVTPALIQFFKDCFK